MPEAAPVTITDFPVKRAMGFPYFSAFVFGLRLDHVNKLSCPGVRSRLRDDNRGMSSYIGAGTG